MKKLLTIVLALFMVVGFTAIATADDRLAIDGGLRVFAWDDENADFTDAKDDHSQFFKQRFRLGTYITVSEGVSVYFRADFGETSWGSGYSTGSLARPSETSEISIDYAYAEIDREMWTLTAGQQYVGRGKLTAIDGLGTGFDLQIKLPVVVRLYYGKKDEGASLQDEADANKDIDQYIGSAVFSTDAFTVGGFYGMLDDKKAADVSPTVIGVHGNVNVGPVAIKGEYDHFAGSNGSNDFVGDQFFIQGTFNIGDMGSISGQFQYALGNDSATETQITSITDWSSYLPSSWGAPGAFVSEFSPTDSDWTDGFEIGPEAGAMTYTVWGSFTVMEGLALSAGIFYSTPQDASQTNIDSMTVVNLGVAYTGIEGVTIAGLYSYAKPAYDDSTVDDPHTILGGVLKIDF